MSVNVSRVNRTLVLTIDRPEAMNALDVASMQQLRQELTAFRDDNSLATCVLTGAGDRAFCAGTDLKQVQPPSTSFTEGYLATYEDSLAHGLYIRALELSGLKIGKPLIAAINGHAMGAGLELALQCAIRIITPKATLGLPEARWATVPGVGGATRLLRAVPRAVAMHMLLTGDRISANESHRIGLVSEVVSEKPVLERALEIAERIGANGPLAVKSLMALTERSQDLSVTDSMALEEIMWGMIRDTKDRTEGREAFVEGREPEYRGH